jgi:hypothetical protein
MRSVYGATVSKVIETGKLGELERLEFAQAAPVAAVTDITRLLADLPARAARVVERLEETLAAGDLPRAREEIRRHVGMVTMEADEHEVRLYGEQGVAVALMRAAGGSHASIDGSGGVIANDGLPAIALRRKAS